MKDVLVAYIRACQAWRLLEVAERTYRGREETYARYAETAGQQGSEPSSLEAARATFRDQRAFFQGAVGVFIGLIQEITDTPELEDFRVKFERLDEIDVASKATALLRQLEDYILEHSDELKPAVV